LNGNSLKSAKLSLADVVTLAQTEGSNNSGEGNMYYYTHKLGEPKQCTLYKAVNINGGVTYSESSITGGAGWIVTTVSGMVETCHKDGNGCTVYSCHVTSNTNP
jgi:hypothetical protein